MLVNPPTSIPPPLEYVILSPVENPWLEIVKMSVALFAVKILDVADGIIDDIDLKILPPTIDWPPVGPDSIISVKASPL